MASVEGEDAVYRPFGERVMSQLVRQNLPLFFFLYKDIILERTVVISAMTTLLGVFLIFANVILFLLWV